MIFRYTMPATVCFSVRAETRSEAARMAKDYAKNQLAGDGYDVPEDAQDLPDCEPRVRVYPGERISRLTCTDVFEEKPT
jgi:hypothetical protein